MKRLPLPPALEGRRARAEWFAKRLKQSLSLDTDGPGLERLASLADKGLQPGATMFVAPRWRNRPGGRWAVGAGDKINAYAGKDKHSMLVSKVPSMISKLEKQGHLMLADSLRIAFLLSDESLGGSADGATKPASNLLQALSGATSLDSLPVKYQRKAAATAMMVPQGKALLEYQKVGVAFIIHSKLRAYVADAMGLGKTIESIVALSSARQSAMPAVVVCPSSVLHNWKKEILAWAPGLEPVIIGNTMPRPKRNTVYIVSWARLHRVVRPLLRAKVRCAIYDEAQAIKTSGARRSKAARALGRRIPHVIMLSGTPLENRVSELFHPLHIIDAKTYPTLAAFEEKISSKRTVKSKNSQGRVVQRTFAGGTPGKMLDGLLRDVMLRRTKTQVLKQLPPKRRIFLTVDLPRPAKLAYDKTESEIGDYLAVEARRDRMSFAAKYYKRLIATGTAKAPAELEACAVASRRGFKVTVDALARLRVLRQLVGQAKIPLVVQWILERPAEPVLVFCEHRAVAKALWHKLARVRRTAMIDGGVNAAKRAQIIDAFQAGKLDVLVATRALATGVTLTRARRVLFTERWWLPTVEEQGEDRVHRIGQERHVEIYYLHGRDTIDQHIAEIVDRKRLLVNRIMGAEDVDINRREEEIAGEASMALSTQLAQAVASRLSHSRDNEVTPAQLREYLAMEGGPA